MKEFIDERNVELWNQLNEDYNIEVEPSFNNEYSCFTQNDKAVIYVDFQNISKDSFTHELLHIYLKHKEFYLGSSLKLTLQQSNILRKYLSENLLEHIGNCLDHLKMFKIYNDLGFDKNLFLLDFEENKCNTLELANLKANFKIKRNVNPLAIDFYIGKLIAMLCDPNEKHNYNIQLSEFKKLDVELFKIVEKLVNETKEFDIESNDLLNSYRDISTAFYSRLVKWIHKNNIK